jgi:hypothetical protein
VLKKVHGGQGDYSTGCACSVAAFSEVVTNKESQLFLYVLTQIAETESISFLPPYVIFFQIVYYIQNGLQ